MRGYTPAAGDKEKVFQRRVAGAVQAAQHKGGSFFLGFLSLREQALCLAVLSKLEFSGYVLNGGYQNAERLMLCVFDDMPKPFPFVCAEITVAEKAGQLTHRDYLGALLALGLQRECFGDIIVVGNRAKVFMHSKIFAFVREELRQAGRQNILQVKQLAFADEDKQAAPAKATSSASVASLRLDAVLAAMCSISRKDAALHIEKGLVQVNHLEVKAVSYNVYENDVFSVRGTGKFKLMQIAGKSRKNRLFINYLKY